MFYSLSYSVYVLSTDSNFVHNTKTNSGWNIGTNYNIYTHNHFIGQVSPMETFYNLYIIIGIMSILFNSGYSNVLDQWWG